jgi:hypothetical protein
MRGRRAWVAAALAAIFVAVLVSWPRAGPAAPPYADRIHDASRPLAVLGDTQRTSFLERLIGREVNLRESTRIVEGIVREAPSALVLVGDMVLEGGSFDDWRHFDDLMRPVRAGGLPLLALMGNHDYMGSTDLARSNAAARFPGLRETTWYSRRQARLGLLLIDSNRGDLGRAWEDQLPWYRATLDAFDADAAIRGVFVFAHHAPYTRVPGDGGSADARTAFVPGFLASAKTLAFITGHTHSYEHYVKGAKHFIVSSGGGGPRPTSLVPPEERGLDERCALPAPRPFHYLLIDQNDSGVTIRVRGLGKGESEIRDVEPPYSIPFADGRDKQSSRPAIHAE